MQVFISFLNQRMMKAPLHISIFCDQCHEKKNMHFCPVQRTRTGKTEAGDDFAFRPKIKSEKNHSYVFPLKCIPLVAGMPIARLKYVANAGIL